MTAQNGDFITYEGRKGILLSEPLRKYLIQHPEIQFGEPNTANYRGYRAEWEIKDNKLYMTKLWGWDPAFNRVGMEYVFPDLKEIFAYWYTGELRLPRGRMIEYIHAGYSSRYERELFLGFKEGELQTERLEINRRSGQEVQDDDDEFEI